MDKKSEHNKILNYYLGYSTDQVIRYEASSGGIGTGIIKYLLESGMYGTSMTFVFNVKECRYEPKLIFDYSEYNNCGSVYQDTDTIHFIKEHIEEIKNGIVVTCMPCQVNAIRNILNRNKIKNFIISLCCSGQTTIQGTWLYYKLLGINKIDVRKMQYRGNGWPAGIRIELENGNIITRDNYTFPWTLMHQSLLYRPKRCIYCAMKTNPNSDVSLADPWLKEYIENDKIGNTLVICNELGDEIIRKMIEADQLVVKIIDRDVYVKSQLGTIEKKEKSNKQKFFNEIIVKMGVETSIYKKIVSFSVHTLKIHIKFIKVLKKIL